MQLANSKIMENDKSKNENEENKDEMPLPVHNPLNPDDDKKISQEEIDNEQKYKEALTERD